MTVCFSQSVSAPACFFDGVLYKNVHRKLWDGDNPAFSSVDVFIVAKWGDFSVTPLALYVTPSSLQDNFAIRLVSATLPFAHRIIFATTFVRGTVLLAHGLFPVQGKECGAGAGHRCINGA